MDDYLEGDSDPSMQFSCARSVMGNTECLFDSDDVVMLILAKLLYFSYFCLNNFM